MEVVITGIDYEKTFKFNEELSMNDLNEEGTFSLNNNGLTGFDKRLIKYCYMIKIQELMEHLNMKGNYMRVKLFNIFSLFFFEKI